MITIVESANAIQEFEKGSLTDRISTIENALIGADTKTCNSVFPSLEITPNLLDAAFTFKRTAGQINVLIHAIGILLSLPHILQYGEIVEALSLGAGNTGRPFDLETNYRIAEFKFINWKGGAESIRQNALFKDFYLLAEYETLKKRFLYIISTKYPLKFLNGGRSLESVMSRNNKLWADFQKRYGNQYSKVCDYYHFRKSAIQLVDISEIIPQFSDIAFAENDNAESL
jgi:hypothetical protein